MKFIAFLRTFDGHCPNGRGEGSTPEEAQKNLLGSLWVEVEVEIAPGVFLSDDVWKKTPRETPPGLTLVIFERCSHNSGCEYNWRFLALDPGTRINFDGCKMVVGTEPGVVSTLDSNSESTCLLPKGSMQYVEGQWVPCSRVDYDY